MRSYCGQCEGEEFCGPCYSVKRGRQSKSAAGRSPKIGAALAAQPIKEEAPIPIRPIRYGSEAWRDLYPNLWCQLTQGRDPEGHPRQTSTLLVFLEAGGLKLCLNERSSGRVAFLTVSGLPEGLAQLEGKLADGGLEWRRKKPIR